MPEPLLGRGQLVARWDRVTGDVELTGAIPGPAGIACFDVGDVSVAIDAAHPAQLCSVTIPGVSGVDGLDAHRSVLDRLIGEDRVTELREHLDGLDARAWRLGADASRQRGPAGVRRDVALLAQAMEQLETPGLLPAERAVAVVEAVGLAGRAGLLDDMPGLGGRLAEAVTLLWSAQRSANRRPRWSGTIIDTFEEVAAATADREVRARLEQMVSRAMSASEPRKVAARVVASVVSRLVPPTPVAVPVTEAPESLPRLVGGPALGVFEGSGDELIARLAGWGERADGWWVRAFSGDELVPLALAPMRADGVGNAVATFLVARQHREHLELDVVDGPVELRSPRPVGALRRAISTGQRAARLERLGDRRAASDAWRECSDWHETAGDRQRSKLAHAIAMGQELGSFRRSENTLRPLVSDEWLTGRGV